MLKFSGFHFTKAAFIGLFILTFALISVDASAQSETEKMEDTYLKHHDRVSLEDYSSIQDNQSSTFPISIPTVSPSKTSATVKRDLPAGGVSDKDIKKSESPSTLSFNIFLYIVDKFKAD